MIELYVSGQNLKYFTPVVAADSLNYLTAKVNFDGSEWDGYSKWLHFRQDEELGADTYDMQLNEDNEITADQRLNLTVGQWEIYLTGTKEKSRLTTIPVILTVKESGLIDSPLHELPMSVAEQVDYNARQALRFAQEVRDAAERGEFDGTSLSPLGHFETVVELEALIPNPKPGDVYSVGEEMPYDIYTWDSINFVWRNQGQLQGPPGEVGKDGTVFIPSVDANGNLSWNNDGGLENPATRNIMGPPGKDGSVGPAGPGAFEKAKEAGYTGTEETFYAALTYMPYHNRRHLPEGADPIIMQTGNYADASVGTATLADAAVTRAKLAQDALFSNTIIRGTSDFVASDIGGTIQNIWNTSATYTLTQEFSATLPTGATFAVLRVGSWAANFDVLIKSSGIRLGVADDRYYTGSVTLKILGFCNIVAIRKIAGDATNGDLWVAYGMVEAVS